MNVSTTINTTSINTTVSSAVQRNYEICSEIYIKTMFGLGISLVLLGITASFGNAITCLVIIRNRSFHSTTYMLLFSLGLSDFLVSSILVPFDAGSYLTYDRFTYVYSPFWVVIYNSLNVTLISLSILNLFLIGIDRFITIRYPFSRYVSSSKRKMKIGVVCVWLYCFVFFLSTNFIQEWPKEGEYDYLLPNWFKWMSSCLNWILPTLMNVLIYIYILNVVIKQRKSIARVSAKMGTLSENPTTTEHFKEDTLRPIQEPSMNATQKSLDEAEITLSVLQQQNLSREADIKKFNQHAESATISVKRKVKVKSHEAMQSNRLFLWVGINFLIFWLPHFSYQIFLIFKFEYVYTCMGDFLECFMLSLTYINNAVNVFVYGASSKKFRKAYKKLFLDITCKN